MESNFEIRFSRSGEKSLKRLSNSDIERVLGKLPLLHGFSQTTKNVKRLKGVSSNVYRLRVGDLRVIFEVEKKKLIWILFVGYRSNIYRSLG